MSQSALKSRTVAAAIAEALRTDILSGALASGAQLRQDALAGAYGVSRIPVREALLALEGEGLVRIVPHKGAVVSALSAEEVGDVFDLRVLLEPRLARASIPLLTGEDLAELDAIQARFAEAIARQDRALWGALNAQLHLTMYRRAPLQRSLAVVAGLLQASERYTRMQMARAAADRRAEAEHADLIALCRAGKAEEAARLLAAHIESVRTDMLALMGGGG